MGHPKPEKRADILSFLVTYITQNGFAPSVREIGQAVGLRSTNTVHHHLAEMEREGVIRLAREAEGKGRGRSRTIALVVQDCCPLCGRGGK